MAPEQHRGEANHPTIDQYAFCVALWEALARAPPFTGPVIDMAVAKHMGPPAWPERVAIPRPIVRALQRGLASDATHRWPSMHALLEALEYDPSRRRRRWATTAGALGLLGLGGAAVQWWASSRAERCTGAREQLEGIWDDDRKAEIESAIVGTGAPYAGEVWSRTEASLDEHARTWVSLHTDTCEAATVRGEQSLEVMHRRSACLRRALIELGATADVLAAADVGVARRAHHVVDGLRSLDRCADVEALAAEVEPPPPEDAQAVTRIHELVARAQALRRAGRDQEAEASVEQAQVQLGVVSYAPIGTPVAIAHARGLVAQGHYEESESVLAAALETASRFRQRRSMADTANLLMLVVGHHLAHPEQALHYREILGGLTYDDPRAKAEFHANLGQVRLAQGQYTAAEAEFRLALTQDRDALGPRHVRLARRHLDLGRALLARGDHSEAKAAYHQALQIVEQKLGSQHPDAAEPHHRLAEAMHAQGRHEEAETEIELALALRMEAEPEHLTTARSRVLLARILLALHQAERAQPVAELAWDRLRQDDARADDRADAAFTLARVSRPLGGDASRARQLAQLALERYEQLGKARADDADQVRTWLREPG